jgi:hypothetical protein
MRRIALLAIATGFFIPLLASAPASAQATRTWVSGVGDDVNPCSRTAPCKTFAGAISKTAGGGEINCLDPAGFGGLTIIKAMTVNCGYTLGSALVAGGPGITINAGVNDRVTLRGIQLTGINQTVTPGTIGVRILAGKSVSIEDSVISNFSQQGVLDSRSAGNTKLSIRNTIISNNNAAGVSLTATNISFTVLDNVLSLNNLNGISVATSNTVMIKRSVLSGNSGDGVSMGAGGLLQIDDSAVSNNGNGFNSAGTVKVSNSDIIGNTTAFAGTNITFGNNRITGTLGTAPTPAGGASNNLGQQ